MPACATKLKNGTWIMSGISVLKDGNSLMEIYGADLDKLSEGDKVAVVRTHQGDLIFYVNGESQGIAARDIPKNVYGIVNLYGKCGQVTVLSSENMEVPVVPIENIQNVLQNIDIPMSVELSINNQSSSLTFGDQNDKLRFHTRCGSLVKLSVNCR